MHAAPQDAPEAAGALAVDRDHRVRRADHVEVQVRADRAALRGLQRRHVAARPVEAELLHAPEPEAHRRARRARADRPGSGEQGRHAAPVVVDPGARRHRVEVPPGHHHGVAASAALADHVHVGALARGGADPQPHARARHEPVRHGPAHDRHGQAGAGHRERGGGRGSAACRVGDQKAGGPRRLRSGRLDAEEASERLGEHHVAGLDPGELRGAAAVARRAQRPVGAARAREQDRPEVAPVDERAAGIDPQRRLALGPPRVAERPQPDGPAGAPQRPGHVARRPPVAGRAGRAVPAAPVRDPLEGAQVAAHHLRVDRHRLGRAVGVGSAGVARRHRGGAGEHG